MASHMIDDMVLDIAFDADAGLRDDEWRSYLSGKLLPAIESVLDRHVHRDGVLVLPEVELDLGDIPFDGFQEEMTRRIERQLTDLLQQRQAQLADGEKERAGRIALVSHARRAIERLADFLTGGVLTAQEDIADADSHRRLLDQVLETNPAGLHALLRLSARRKQAIARLVAQFPASALQRLAQTLHTEIDVTVLIDRLLTHAGKPLLPASRESLRLRLWQTTIDTMLDGGDVRKALTDTAEIDVGPSGIAASMKDAASSAADAVTNAAANISSMKPASDMSQQAHPASPHGEPADNAEALRAAHRRLLQACAAGDAAMLSRLLEEGRGDAIRSVLRDLAGTRQIAERMAETLPSSLLAELIVLLQPKIGNFLRALRDGLPDMRPGGPTAMQTGMQPNTHEVISAAERHMGPYASNASSGRLDWSALERKLMAALFLSVLDAVKTSASLATAIRRVRQKWESAAEQYRQSSGLAEMAAAYIVPPASAAEFPTQEISEKMARLPAAASAVLQQVLFGTLERHASVTSSERLPGSKQSDSIPSFVPQRATPESSSAAAAVKTHAEAALEDECWRLALAVLLERERLAAQSVRDRNNAAVHVTEADQRLRTDAGARTASGTEGLMQAGRLSSSPSSLHRATAQPREAAGNAAAESMRAWEKDERLPRQTGSVPFSDKRTTENMPSIDDRSTVGHDIEGDGHAPEMVPASGTKKELNDRSRPAERKEIKNGEPTASNDFQQCKNNLQDSPVAGVQHSGNVSEPSLTQSAIPSPLPDATASAEENAVTLDIAAIVDSLMRIADAWQDGDSVATETAEPVHDIAASVETETNLRHRLARALLTGDAAGIEGDWPMLLRRQPEMIVQAVRHYMQMAGVRERMARGFPEAMLSDLLALLEPQAAALHAEQQKRLHFLTEKEGAAARRSLWECAWQQLPPSMQASDAAAYAKALTQRADAILRNAAVEAEQGDALENMALEQAYRRYQHVHDVLLGRVTLTPQAATDAEILQQEFPVLLRQLMRTLRAVPPSMAQLVYDERLYAVLLPKAIVDGDASVMASTMTSAAGAKTAFLEAIFSHARHAADRSAYYRGVLAALLREEAVDLDALAARQTDDSAQMADVAGMAAQKSEKVETGNANQNRLSETVKPSGGDRSIESSGQTVAMSDTVEDIFRTPELSGFSHLHRMLSAPDRVDTQALQALILETAAARPETMQPVWDALRAKRLPRKESTFTRETWRSLLIAWMRSRLSAERIASVLASLDRDAKSADSDDDCYRIALLDMLNMFHMRHGSTIHAQADESESVIPSAMPLVTSTTASREQREAPRDTWQPEALNVLLAGAHNDAAARQTLQRWLSIGLSGHASALRAVLLATLSDLRMAGLFAAAMPEALLAATLASIDTRHALKRFRADWVEDVFLAIDRAASPRLRTAKWQHLLHRAATGAGEGEGDGDRTEYAIDLARHLIDETGTAHADEVLAAVRRPMPTIPLLGKSETNATSIADTGNDSRQRMASASAQYQSTHQSTRATLPSANIRTGDTDSRTAAGSDTQEAEEAPRNRPEQEIHIPNAGMVLAAPYIPHLFALLKLTEQGRFVDPKAAERAVHLLQFMVDKRTATPEYQLVLNKLLCGVKTGTPIVAGIDITDHERETVESLLQGMIANWGALGSTSIDGLRASFLQRPGWLRRQEDGWHLQVEKRAYDMLLDRLPWSFSMIRHGWMPTLLRVDWR